jgi:glyceraldehyde-3-phosphate dehydrogenase (NADP+)
LILKPSEKAPLTTARLVELLSEGGLPGHLLSCIHGSLDDVTRRMIRDERVSLVTFTGNAAVGEEIAATGGYQRTCLQLGGHSPPSNL